MSQIPITASAIIPARLPTGSMPCWRMTPAATPVFCPNPIFDPPVVEQGGFGEGTVITFQMRLMGQTRTFHSTISEPDPGRVLAEKLTQPPGRSPPSRSNRSGMARRPS